MGAKKRRLDSEPNEKPLEGMPKDQVSKMLGFLKYHAGPRSKAGDGIKSDAGHALAVYSQLTPEKKKEFLKSFNKNRDLAWVRTLSESEETEEKSEVTSQSGWFLRSDSMAMNRFTDQGFSTKSAADEVRGFKLPFQIQKSQNKLDSVDGFRIYVVVFKMKVDNSSIIYKNQLRIKSLNS